MYVAPRTDSGRVCVAGTRAQGPYRELFEDICDEVCSDALPIFSKSPNGLNNVGDNR